MHIGFGSFFFTSLTFMVAFLFLLNRTGYCGQDDYNSDVMIDTCHLTDPQDKIIDLSPNNTQDNKVYGTVTLISGYGYPPNLDCNLTILAPPDGRIFIRITIIDVYTQSYEVCYPDQFTVVPIEGSTGYAYCGYVVPANPISSASRAMVLHFHSGNWSLTNHWIGFRLYYNTFRFGTCDGKTEFRCSGDSRCIPLILKCDGLDNCGDWSDETLETCGLPTWAIVAMAMTCVFGIFCTAVFIFIVCHFYTKKTGSELVSGVPANAMTPINASYAVGVEPPPAYTYQFVPGFASNTVMPMPACASSACYENATGLSAPYAPVAEKAAQQAPVTVNGEGTKYL